MRAAIYNPYLDTLGGGERYTLAVASLLAEKGYEVDLEWNQKSIKEKLEDRFGIDLEKINFVDSINRGSGYDICFWVSDGSIPTLLARKNILHFQIPFTKVGGGGLLNKMKLFRIKKVVCNSLFTKKFIDKEFSIKSAVLYPPVSVEKFKPAKKEKVILSVGRFSQLTQSKRQDVLIKAFKKFYDLGNKDWKLILAGGSEVGADKFLKGLKESAKTYPIKIVESPSFTELKKLYANAAIFWSASGYGEDELENPKKVEHFGIVVVEAMAAGCVPFIYNAGGSKEIISDHENGFLWHNTRELIKQTKKAILVDLLVKVSRRAKEDSKKFSYEEFNKGFMKLLI